ncbi:MAG: GDSL-type esterase/lipase family protein [Roseovarius sp.]|nr:GDSL-type esterase/lipase family protein [Roseovarius sp.]
MSKDLRRLAMVLSLCLIAFTPTAGTTMERRLNDLECPAAPVTIAVIGDSLADGIWGAFYRAFATCADVRVMRLTEVSDGLAKSPAKDWLDRLETAAPDLTVVTVGANDLTNIRKDRSRLVHGTADWKSEYAARARALAAGLKARSEAVVWMGLPIVGKQEYEASYRQLTELQSAAARQAGVRFVDTHEPTTFGQGQFVMSTRIDGTVRQVRHSDQVHFTELGYDMVAALMQATVSTIFTTASRDADLGAVALQ